MVYRFHCDLSYDGNPPGNAKGKRHIPNTYVFAGFFATQQIWESIECEWESVNKYYRVPRFHAAHLNGKTNEYAGWDDGQKKCYSADLLGVLSAQGKQLSAVTCGMFADDFRAVINDDGRRKMGSPYLACFNSCVTRVARAMDANGFPANDKFSALIDEDDEYLTAIDSFNRIRIDPKFDHGHRMGTCTSANMGLIAALQPADLIAYEVFKWMQEARKTPGIKCDPKRYPLQYLLENNSVSEGYWERRTLGIMKDEIESTQAMDGGLVLVPGN